MKFIAGLILGNIEQKTVFYKDKNKNSILDSEDEIIAEINDGIANSTPYDFYFFTKSESLFDKTAKEIANKYPKEVIEQKQIYTVSNKEITISEYNNLYMLQSFIDFFVVAIIIMVIWFFAFPKKLDSSIVNK